MRRSISWALSAVAVACLSVLVASMTTGPVTAGVGAGPVLGSPRHLAPIGQGWGVAHPAAFANGGDPGGSAFHVTWTGWGDRRAHALGQTWIGRPDGGYYGRPGRIALRAERIGRCPDGTYAYRRLLVRISRTPLGPLSSRWRRWGPQTDLCARF